MTDFSADWFAGYMLLRTSPPIDVLEFERFTRGTSRQTWFVRFRTKGEIERRVTLRTDHPAGAGDPTSLDQEFGIYDRLGALDLPVARALFWEDSPALCPRPFYLREMVEGSWRIPGYGGLDRAAALVRLEASREHMRALAQVHDSDWQRVGLDALLGAPTDCSQVGQFYVDRQLGLLARFDAEPQPLLSEVARVLRDTAPRAARISLCKGTNGLGEEVFRDGKLVALSDWEEAWIGDPASDLAMVQGFTEAIDLDGERVWDLERALAFYNQVAPVPVSIENVRYYQLARMFGRLVMFAYTSTVVHNSPEATVRQSWTATEVQHAVKRALASALGIGRAPDLGLFEELNQSVDMLAGEEA